MTKRGTLSIAIAGLGLAVLAMSGCGSSSNQDYGGGHPDYTKALAGSPPALAALHGQANQLLDGGVDAYEKRIASLRGYPVVTNVWGSWCVPCRAEFPTLQKLSARYGKEVGFLGVDYEDPDDAAETFLEEAPLSYPSYSDHDGTIASSMGIPTGVPDTAFYAPSGELCYVKHGQYAEQSELEADVRRYALGDGCNSG
jgi:cytochrome c biogenesis protein CcmG, thiol:disulfide interchange protein DsbE